MFLGNSTECLHLGGCFDVKEDVGFFMFVDVGQSSGVRLVFCHRADPGSVLVMKTNLTKKIPHNIYNFKTTITEHEVLVCTKGGAEEKGN